jgi:hypothetical protein
MACSGLCAPLLRHGHRAIASDMMLMPMAWSSQAMTNGRWPWRWGAGRDEWTLAMAMGRGPGRRPRVATTGAGHDDGARAATMGRSRLTEMGAPIATPCWFRWPGRVYRPDTSLTYVRRHG